MAETPARAKEPGPLRRLPPVPLARVAATVLAAVVFLGAAWVGGARAKPSSVPARGKAHAVVLFGIPQLGVADLRSGDLPNLHQLIGTGALAAMTPHTLRHRAGSLDTYATISAGSPVRGTSGADDVYQAGASVEGSTAREVATRRSGVPPDGRVVAVQSAAQINHAGSDLSSAPGDLGFALHVAGLDTAVITNADRRDANGLAVVSRPAAIATMDRSGSTDVGEVGGGLLMADPTAPYGIRADPDRIMSHLASVLPQASFIVIDPGDTDRAYGYAGAVTKPQADVLRQAALRRTDALLGRVAAALPADDLLLVVGISPPTGSPGLTPIVAHGAGVVPGHLASESTKRADLVTLTDLTPTILDALGVKVPSGMIGQVLRYHPGPVDQASLVRADKAAAAREHIYTDVSHSFITIQAIAYLAILVLLLFGAKALSPRQATVARIVAVSFAAWPVATFLLRLVPSLAGNKDGAQLAVWGLSLLLAALADLRTRHPLDPLARVAALTVAILLVDLAIGGYLQTSTILGYSPYAAARFTGIGNAAYSVLGAAAIVWAVVHVDRSPRKGEALLDAAALLGVVAIVDGAPTLGSDVGGILSLIPVFALLLWVLSGHRISWRVVALAGIATVCVLGLATIIDLLRPADARTHLGRLVAGSGSGNGLSTTISRKISTNLKVLTGTIWMWMVPITATSAAAHLAIVRARGTASPLPKGSAARAGYVALVGLGLLGSAVNDSGILIAGTVAIFVGPYLTLLIAARPDDRPEPPPSPLAAEPERPLVGAAPG